MDNMYFKCRDCGYIQKEDFTKCPRCFGDETDLIFKCQGAECDNYSEDEMIYCKECQKHLQNMADDILNYMRNNYLYSEDEYKYMINYLYNRFNK